MFSWSSTGATFNIPPTPAVISFCTFQVTTSSTPGGSVVINVLGSAVNDGAASGAYFKNQAQIVWENGDNDPAHDIGGGTLMLTTVGAPLGFNVDINISIASAPGAGVPANAFGGAANQPGHWNAMTGNATNLTLRNLSGALTTVTLQRNSASGGDFAFNNPNTSGDFESLLDDGQSVGSAGNSRLYTFQNLPPGRYEVFTYAINPDSSNSVTKISVDCNTTGNQVDVGGTMPVNTFQEGMTHSVHEHFVCSDGVLVITATTAAGAGTISGIQVKPLSQAQQCPADNTGDGVVNIADLLGVISAWGTCP